MNTALERELASTLKKLQNELGCKHRELALHVELLSHSRKLKEKLMEDVGNLHSYLNPEGRAKLSSLLKQLKWDLNDEATLSLERKFDQVHAQLYATLERTCPEITKNEKRLCAYLSMNHCAADIAKITSKTLNSVNVGFARLRVKLDLTSNKDLKVFLAELTNTPSINPMFNATYNHDFFA